MMCDYIQDPDTDKAAVETAHVIFFSLTVNLSNVNRPGVTAMYLRCETQHETD